MSSAIPTRRTTRRIDENAPPASGIPTRARSAAGASTAAAPAAASSTAIPVMKRTHSASAATRDNKVPFMAGGTESKPLAGKLATRRRAALGELHVGPDAKDAKDSKDAKGKGAAERRPLASTLQQQPLRRTTRAAAAAARDAARDQPEEKHAAVKRKAGTSSAATSTATRTRPGVSRLASAASATSSTSTLAASRHARALKPTASLPEVGPATKRLRASSSSPDDVFGDAQHDDDDEPFVDALGRSPKRRPKDFGWTDLDAEDELDPSMVSEYVVDAFKYMLEIEQTTLPNPDYMEQQEELQWKMRAILNDWIIEVHSKFRLLPETLFIAINLIDRFLSARLVSLVKFQLVGLTALFVAAKYEEVICPSVTHFLHMTDGGYDVSEILRAERYLLQTLSFDLSYPNPLHFLRRVSKADGYDVHARTVAKFFIEISCLEHLLLPFPPSQLAAAAMWLARLCLGRGAWHANMVHYSAYTQDELLPCAQIMLDYVVDKKLDLGTAFFKKYASKKHLKASVFVREWAVSRWPHSASGSASSKGRELDEFANQGEAPPPPCTP